MLRVEEIMQVAPPCVDASDSVVLVARAMRQHGLDQLPVCQDGNFLAMVSQVDIVRRCVAAGLDPRATPISRLVDGDEGAVQGDAPAEEALLMVLHTGQRCLAVVQGRRLVGTITHSDLVQALPDDTVSGILAVVSRG